MNSTSKLLFGPLPVAICSPLPLLIDCGGIVERTVLAGFEGQYDPQIRRSKKGICGTTLSANPVFQRTGFVAQNYPQIPWSLQCVECVGSTLVESVFKCQ